MALYESGSEMMKESKMKYIQNKDAVLDSYTHAYVSWLKNGTCKWTCETEVEIPDVKSDDQESSLVMKIPVSIFQLTGNSVNNDDIITSLSQELKDELVFVCRVISPSIRLVSSLTTIVDDPSGSLGIRVVLHNFNPTDEKVPILPVGTILAINHLVVKTESDGEYYLESKYSKDVRVLDKESCGRIFPAVKWCSSIPGPYRNWKNSEDYLQNLKRLGNQYYDDGKYDSALQTYNSALLFSSKNVSMLSNRAATLLNLERFEDALKDAESVLEIQHLHIKATYRKSRALCGMQKYREAFEFLDKQIGNLGPDSNSVELKCLMQTFENVKELVEQKKGNYNMAYFMGNPDVRFANYTEFTGPVKIADIPGKGRGLVVTEDVESGQLLIASKAFSIEFGNTRNFEGIIEAICTRLKNEPKLRNDLYKLYTGPKIEFLDVNSESLEKLDPNEEEDRIYNICYYNCFGGDLRPPLTPSVSDLNPLGLWILPSYINHSCMDSNATYRVTGDFLFVRAFKNIAAGEEILIPYVEVGVSYDRRATVFESLGFSCDCQLCVVERNESEEIHEKRAKFMAEVQELFGGRFDKFPMKEFTAVENLISYMENLRPNNPDLNVFLAGPFGLLASYYSQFDNYEMTSEILEKAFELVKDLPVGDASLHFANGLVISHMSANNTAQAQKWFALLKNQLLRIYGTTDIMELIDGEFFKEMIRFGLEF